MYFISGVYSHNLAKSSDGRSPQTKIPKETKKNTDLEPEAYRKSVSNGWYLLIEGESIMSFLFGGGSYFHSFLNDRQKQL